MRTTILVLASSLILTNCGGGGSGGGTAPATSPTQVNRAPTVANANADQTATNGVAFSYDATQAGQTFNDLDGDVLTYSISYSPAANGLTDSAGVLGGTPDQVGLVTVTITANDGNGGSVSDSFNVDVLAPSIATKPNILLIISDDQGQDSSAQYSLSSDHPATPVLNDLAASGIVFDNLWVNPVCTPTRASLMTGIYGNDTGVLAVGDPLPTSETIIHELIDSDANTAEYVSALIGKWHLGGGQSGPNDAGIDHFAGIIGGGVSDYYSWNFNLNGTTTNNTNYVTSEITDQAIDWIGNQTNPWFLWLAYNAPHTPFHLPPNSLHSRTLSGTTADINANSREYYLAAIEAMDTEIGRLLSSMPSAERDNTIIMFIGDNGTPGQVRDQAVFPNGAKGSLTQGGVNVPMIVSGAGVSRVGERETRLINGVDFYSTIAELAGSEIGNQNDSVSFVSALNQSGAIERDHIYSEVEDGSWTVRDARYKLNVSAANVETLFDLENDPQENTDLLSGSGDVSGIRDPLRAAGDAFRQ
ncbi:sulfatase-like hydrolase/transferase [Hirschia maritima]|uniref:sulfatase-like hydrolase/transferase n=1 Tax=Hirschia maritima TaxID=1121961 RepID=UPI00035D11CE|nr:sulfatase-like hydrolase/transferase [Hirschia maritima]